jgi:hypothetical protein
MVGLFKALSRWTDSVKGRLSSVGGPVELLEEAGRMRLRRARRRTAASSGIAMAADDLHDSATYEAR